jgi:biopolymer transport protein ExbD
MMTFGRFRQGADLFEPMAEINVTPLVDVTLVLLSSSSSLRRS